MFVLHQILGTCATYLHTSKHEWEMVPVSMTKPFLVTSCFQYQIVLAFIILGYSAFTISLPVFMTCLSNVFSYRKIYGSDNSLTT